MVMLTVEFHQFRLKVGADTKTSTLISKNHAMIVTEDLKVTNMSKSAAGTIETPGRSVKAKSGLNKSILDQGWGEFRR